MTEAVYGVNRRLVHLSPGCIQQAAGSLNIRQLGDQAGNKTVFRSARLNIMLGGDNAPAHPLAKLLGRGNGKGHHQYLVDTQGALPPCPQQQAQVKIGDGIGLTGTGTGLDKAHPAQGKGLGIQRLGSHFLLRRAMRAGSSNSKARSSNSSPMTSDQLHPL